MYRNKSAVRLDEETPIKVTNFNPNLYKSSTAHRIFQKHDDDTLSTNSKQNGQRKINTTNNQMIDHDCIQYLKEHPEDNLNNDNRIDFVGGLHKLKNPTGKRFV